MRAGVGVSVCCVVATAACGVVVVGVVREGARDAEAARSSTVLVLGQVRHASQLVVLGVGSADGGRRVGEGVRMVGVCVGVGVGNRREEGVR
jgi:hypothetical protein